MAKILKLTELVIDLAQGSLVQCIVGHGSAPQNV